jgi:hypothetical protein
MDDNTILCMLLVAMYAVRRLCRIARGVEAIGAELRAFRALAAQNPR